MRLAMKMGYGVMLIAFCSQSGCVADSGAEPAKPAQSFVQSPPLVPQGTKQSAGSGYTDGGDSLRFVAHEENLPVGFPSRARYLSMRDPYEGNARGRSAGGQLFIAYNCVDCHGAEGSGAMGPSFQDGRWHFGGSAGAVFESIYEGRPDGMPSWGGRIGNDQIWMLTSYVRSLAKKDLSTENFTGATVERTGH